MIDIVIPIREETAQLEKALKSISAHTNNTEFRINLVKDSTINVSEARQQALENKNLSDHILYMDEDSEILDDHWLDNMLATLQANPDAGVVYAGEWWGTEEETLIVPQDDYPVEYGPAACMLIDRSRLSEYVHWDRYIGLRNTWLGGDFEEVDFCHRVLQSGLSCLHCTKARFHHTGNKTTLMDFRATDRYKTARIMHILLGYKYAKAPKNEDYFKDLQYVKASDDNMDTLADKASLRECYYKVINQHKLQNFRLFRHWGLI